MEESNKSYRIRTNIGSDKFLTVKLDQDYDVLEILSLKISEENAYKFHTSDYGVVVGRVLANGGFGVPNAKLSIFISKESGQTAVESMLYSYSTSRSVNEDGVRYNLLPDTKVEDCHNAVGTFPSKRFVLDNNEEIEVFDKYYRLTTRTNDAGDYMIFGVPTGQQTLHMDLDISDCGSLSQRPRDFIYKGYTIEQFENANQFKTDDELDSLPQIFTQNKTIDVKPFWGDVEEKNTIGITRADIDVNFKFEPTCVFLGSVFTDSANEGITKNCRATKGMGKMNGLTTASGTIEMIRKKSDGTLEEFQIKGTELIDGNGVWCYQIPMNLDYMVTDEYGNLVATDNPEKGIATRTCVRFRISMGDNTEQSKYFYPKVLVPNNPSSQSELDNTFEFGSQTEETGFKNLFWNNVYSVKSYIPRIQGKNTSLTNYKTEKFTGIKTVNNPEGNNPLPYNHIRIKFPFMYSIICAIVHFVLSLIKFTNKAITVVQHLIVWLRNLKITKVPEWKPFKNINDIFTSYISVGSRFCDSLEGVNVIPGAPQKEGDKYYGEEAVIDLIAGTYKSVYEDEYPQQAKDSITSNGKFTIYYKNSNGIYEAVLVGTSASAFSAYILEYPSSTVESDASIIAEYNFTRGIYYTRNDNDWTIDNPDEYENVKDASTKPTIWDSKKDEYTSAVTTQLAVLTTAYSASTDYLGSDTNVDKICLVADGDYLLECIEMTLAEEYEVINFDFYNDWINGGIYMPRWARTVKTRWISGTKKIVACASNASNANRRLNNIRIGDVAPLSLTTTGNTDSRWYKGNEWTDKKIDEKKLWKQARVIINDQLKNKRLVHAAVSHLTGANVYYFLPCAFIQDTDISELKKLNLFATDIILLGSLNSCNSLGMPSIPENMLSTSYKMPQPLAETSNNADDDGNSYTGTGCADVNIIATGKNADLWTRYTGGNGLSTYTDDDNDIYIPFTEEAGISWNYTGPNQSTTTTLPDNRMYSPGGHFLGLACGAKNTMTNFKSSVNLVRACEYGTTLSERIQRPGYYIEDELHDVYIVPNGLISKDEIYDDDYRSAFATMNFNNLKIKRDTDTGYYKYDLSYLMPDNFDGLFSGYTKSYSYNGQIDVTANTTTGIKDDESLNEQAHTYSRELEDFSDDYVRFRFGITGKDEIKKKIITAIPQYENSYYFYFGLKEGNTAIDILKKDFFATCKRNINGVYNGKITATSGYTSDTYDKSYTIIDLGDMDMPVTVTLTDKNGDDVSLTKSILMEVGDDDEENLNETTCIWDEISNKGKAEEDGVLDYPRFGLSLLANTEYTLKVVTSEGLIFDKVLTFGNGYEDLADYESLSAIPFYYSTEDELKALTATTHTDNGGYVKVNYPIETMNSDGTFTMNLERHTGQTFLIKVNSNTITPDVIWNKDGDNLLPVYKTGTSVVSLYRENSGSELLIYSGESNVKALKLTSDIIVNGIGYSDVVSTYGVKWWENTGITANTNIFNILASKFTTYGTSAETGVDVSGYYATSNLTDYTVDLYGQGEVWTKEKKELDSQAHVISYYSDSKNYTLSTKIYYPTGWNGKEHIILLAGHNGNTDRLTYRRYCPTKLVTGGTKFSKSVTLSNGFYVLATVDSDKNVNYYTFEKTSDGITYLDEETPGTYASYQVYETFRLPVLWREQEIVYDSIIEDKSGNKYCIINGVTHSFFGDADTTNILVDGITYNKKYLSAGAVVCEKCLNGINSLTADCSYDSASQEVKLTIPFSKILSDNMTVSTALTYKPKGSEGEITYNYKQYGDNVLVEA